MKPRKDLVGNRYGRLTVVSFAGQGRGGKSVWHCQCDCGGSCDALIDNLQSGNVRSCGCLRREMYQKRTLPHGERAARDRFAAYRNNAKRRGILFELSMETLLHLSQQPCVYCGSEPSNVAKGRSGYGDFICNGIDRIDPSLGYIRENCVPCCGRCNEAKMDLTIDEFKAWVASVYHHIVEVKLPALEYKASVEA